MGKLNKDDFVVLRLSDILETIGNDGYNDLISGFSCPKNKDVFFPET